MRQVVITRHGGPDVLRLVEGRSPEPGPGQVRLRVHAAGVAFADILMRRGAYPNAPKLPFAPGYDVAGTVDKLGDGVADWPLGARAVAFTQVGGYADYVVVPADALIAVPGPVGDVEAVSAVLNYGTAYQLLHRAARVVAGQSLLVHGAGGGVGTALLQLARLLGADAFGTASRGKHGLVRDLGGTPIDYRTEDFVSRVRELTHGGTDVVFDPIGGWHLWRSRAALRAGGTLVAYGLSSAVRDGRPRNSAFLKMFASLGLMKLMPGKRVMLYVSNTEFAKRRARFRNDVASVLALIEQGRLSPVIAEVLPLADAARAHRLLEEGSVSGKLVLSLA